MSSTSFYLYLPSGAFFCGTVDGDNTARGLFIKTWHQLENLSDISLSSEEEKVEMLGQAMKELDIGGVPLPTMVWTSINYKPSQVAQLISLMQNTNMKLPQAAKEARTEYAISYKFIKEKESKWRDCFIRLQIST